MREAAPLAWPAGFAVVETAAAPPDEQALVRVGDPYREPATQAIALRPGLAITWTDDNYDQRVLLGVLNATFIGTSAILWALIGLGVVAGKLPITIGLSLVALALVWFTRMTWRNKHRVIADHAGLHWTRIALSTRNVHERLPASEITQLFVREVTPALAPGEEVGLVVRSYVVYARDQAGNDHAAIAEVERPEQAWWLEARLERHLGIADEQIDGEHRRGSR